MADPGCLHASSEDSKEALNGFGCLTSCFLTTVVHRRVDFYSCLSGRVPVGVSTCALAWSELLPGQR